MTNLRIPSDESFHVDDQRPPGGAVALSVAGDIKKRIEAGQLKPGQRIPAERDLAETYGCGYTTMRRALALLRDEGLVDTIHGRGTFVACAPEGDG